MIIAVIGGIATGKSFVTEYFLGKGLSVIEADKVAHQFLKSSSPVFSRIVKKFGNEILDAEGKIVKRRLAELIFKSPQKRDWLNKLVHPLVYKAMSDKIAELISCGKKDIVLEIPLLTSDNLLPEINKVVLVTTTAELQKERLADEGLEEEEINGRLQAQVPLKEQMKIADYIINNDGSKLRLEQSLENLWDLLQAEWK